jgi:hypothetical protein
MQQFPPVRNSQASTTRSAAAVGFKKRDDFGALLSGGEAAIGLHVVARNYLVWITDEAVERRPVPYPDPRLSSHLNSGNLAANQPCGR